MRSWALLGEIAEPEKRWVFLLCGDLVLWVGLYCSDGVWSIKAFIPILVQDGDIGNPKVTSSHGRITSIATYKKLIPSEMI